jgi:hypothetical protein
MAAPPSDSSSDSSRWPSSPTVARRGTPSTGLPPSPRGRTCRARRRLRPWSCRTRARSWGLPAADNRVRSRNNRPPGMKISFWLGRSAPPDSTRLITGRRLVSAMSEARKILRTVHGLLAPAPHGGVVTDDHALDAFDDTDAGDHAGAHRIVTTPPSQWGELQKRRVGVEEQLDTFAYEQFAAPPVSFDVLPSTPGHGFACSASISASLSSMAAR